MEYESGSDATSDGSCTRRKKLGRGRAAGDTRLSIAGDLSSDVIVVVTMLNRTTRAGLAKHKHKHHFRANLYCPKLDGYRVVTNAGLVLVCPYYEHVIPGISQACGKFDPRMTLDRVNSKDLECMKEVHLVKIVCLTPCPESRSSSSLHLITLWKEKNSMGSSK